MPNPLHFVKLIALLLVVSVLAACGGDSGMSAAEREAQRQRDLRLQQQVSAIQSQLSALDKQIADVRVAQDQQIGQLVQASQAVNGQLAQLRTELGLPAASAPAGPVTAPLPPERSAWDVILRVIIIVAVLASIFFLIKFFYGRMHDDEDEDDEALGEEYKTDLGTVSISPSVQASMGRQADADAPLETADEAVPNDLNLKPGPGEPKA